MEGQCNWGTEYPDSVSCVSEIATIWSALAQITAVRVVRKYNMPTNRSVPVEPRRAEQQQQEDRIKL
jgi:hypothetical protein